MSASCLTGELSRRRVAGRGVAPSARLDSGTRTRIRTRCFCTIRTLTRNFIFSLAGPGPEFFIFPRPGPSPEKNWSILIRVRVPKSKVILFNNMNKKPWINISAENTHTSSLKIWHFFVLFCYHPNVFVANSWCFLLEIVKHYSLELCKGFLSFFVK